MTGVDSIHHKIVYLRNEFRGRTGGEGDEIIILEGTGQNV